MRASLNLHQFTTSVLRTLHEIESLDANDLPVHMPKHDEHDDPKEDSCGQIVD